MRILIIEDDFDKREKIRSHVETELPGKVTITEKESLRSGLKSILQDSTFDLILLDMSMPSFDISVDEPGGGAPESFAGKELMAQMRLRGISIPVVVITQYRSFEGGAVSLSDLTQEFSEKFGQFYWGSIYYNAAVEGWRKELSTHLRKFYTP